MKLLLLVAGRREDTAAAGSGRTAVGRDGVKLLMLVAGRREDTAAAGSGREDITDFSLESIRHEMTIVLTILNIENIYIVAEKRKQSEARIFLVRKEEEE